MIMERRPMAPMINARIFATGILRLMLTAAAGGIENTPGRWRIVAKFCRRPQRSRREIAAELGHTPLRRLSTQSRQKVHSKVQIIASLADGGKSLSQHSQL